MRLIRDGENGGKGVWRWGRGRLYTYRYTVTTRMTSALRWAAMKAILMFHNCEGQSHETVSTDHNFWRERRAEADSNGGSSLPLGQTGSQGGSFLNMRYLYSAHRLVCFVNMEKNSSIRTYNQSRSILFCLVYHWCCNNWCCHYI